jgi:GTP-binding protein
MGSLQMSHRMMRCVLSRASTSQYCQQGPGPVFGVISRNLAQPAKWKQKAPRKKKHGDDHAPTVPHRRQTPASPTSLNSKRKKAVHPEDYHSQPADSFAGANTNTSADAGGMDSVNVPQHVPPALLLPTASRYAYVAQIAAQTAGIDPRSLFADVTDDPQEALPTSFRHGAFHYLPPAAFGHELTHSVTPEIAFLGRSNVGKSSLVNALMRRSLARTSKQPGRTQQVQYYGWLPNINTLGGSDGRGNNAEQKITPSTATAFLVDLPGYGFAVAPHKAADAWQSVTQEWLVDRARSGSLRRLYLLQDGRHGAQSLDLSVQTWLEEQHIPYSIVFTKADGSSRPALVKWVNQACMRYHQHYMDMDVEHGETALAMGPVVHVTSSKTGEGLAELWSAMEAEFATETQAESVVENHVDHLGYDGDVESGDDPDEREHPYDSGDSDDSDGDK